MDMSRLIVPFVRAPIVNREYKERLAKRSKKYYKDIRKYTKIFKINDKLNEYDRKEKRYNEDETKGNVRVTEPKNIPEYKEPIYTSRKEKEQVVNKTIQSGTKGETVAEPEVIHENDSRKDTGNDKEHKENYKKKKKQKKKHEQQTQEERPVQPQNDTSDKESTTGRSNKEDVDTSTENQETEMNWEEIHDETSLVSGMISDIEITSKKSQKKVVHFAKEIINTKGATNVVTKGIEKIPTIVTQQIKKQKYTKNETKVNTFTLIAKARSSVDKIIKKRDTIW